MEVQHRCIELGTGVFEKPGALGDYLVGEPNSNVIVVVPNSSDIRFVENILRRRSLPARRISRALDEADLRHILSWLESQRRLIVVCNANLASKIAKYWGSIIVFYSPPTGLDTYQEFYDDSNNEQIEHRSLTTLLSPQEITPFMSIRNSLDNCEVLTLAQSNTTQSQKSILDNGLKNLPARGSVLATELTRLYASELGLHDTAQDSENLVTLKKLITFFMEQHLGSSPPAAIEEELQLIEELSQEPSSNQDWDDRRASKEHRGSRDGVKNKNSDNRYANNTQGGDRRDNNQRDNRGPNNKHSSPQKKGRDRNDYSGDSYDSRDSRGDSRGGGRNNSRSRNIPKYFPIRVYVGLGSDQNLKPHEIKDFLADTAQIDRDHVGFANVRTRYSFVDLTEDVASAVLGKESGYEFEGKLVTVERALTASRGRGGPAHSGRDSGRGSGRKDRNFDAEPSSEEISADISSVTSANDSFDEDDI